MTDSDFSLPKKQFVCDLRILVIAQIVGLGVAIFGGVLQEFPTIGNIVPRNPRWWDCIALLSMFGWGVSAAMAYLGCHKLRYTNFLPFRLQVYGAIGIFWLWFIFCFLQLLLFFPFLPCGLLLLLFGLWQGYCFFSQFFIVRWLAKEAKGSTI